MIRSLKSALSRMKNIPGLEYWLLGAITLLGLVMRLFQLGTWSLWIDEVYTYNRAQIVFSNLGSLPPLSTILIGAFINGRAGNEWDLRLVPALIGAISIPALYFPTKKLFGVGVALLAALLLALSPWHLFWSQNARFYTAMLLFYSLGMFLVFIGMEEDRPVFLIAGLGFLALSVLERKMALFFVPVLVLYALAATKLPGFGRPAGLRARNLTPVALPALVFGLYETYVLAFSGQESGISEFLRIFIGRHHNPARLLLSVIQDMGLPVFLLALAGGAFLVWRRSRAGLFLLIGTLLPLATIIAIAPFTQTFSRYVFHTLPFWLILSAVALKDLVVMIQKAGESRPAPKANAKNTRLSPANNGILLAAGVILLLLSDSVSQDTLYYGYQNGNRQDWKGAFALVEAAVQANDQVATTRVEIGNYYLDQPVLWTKDLTSSKVVESGRRTWFVVDDRTAFVSPELDRWLQEQARLVGVRDVYRPGLPMDMRIYLYDPTQPLNRIPLP